ncbi:universal stress protein [Winogradskyella sp. 4-2091]|uniref:universal stress protein n=1 Tax=Winogradskyella sp. 4-2091 TaxID=3381659 RepID=UPI0038911B0A
MRQILLLTDFSNNSINAIRYALNLFKDEVCDFHVLHVESSKVYVSDDLVMGGGQSIYDSILKKSKEKLYVLVDDFKSEFLNNNFTFHQVVDYDDLTESINQLNSITPFDLLIMGSNGVSSAKEVLFGSNTINVIRNVKCPTLVVPEGFLYSKPSEVLIPLDVDDTLNSKAFNQLIQFIEHFGDKLHLLRISAADEIALEREQDIETINTVFNAINYLYNSIENVPMEYAVASYIQTHPINLMALMVQKENFIERFFKGSSTTKISSKLRVPLLVFHS